MAEASGPGPVAEAVEEQVAQQQRPSRVPATLTFQGDGAGSCPASPPGGTTMAGLTAGGSPGSPPQASGVGGHHLGWPVTGAEDTGQAMALRYAWVTRGVLALTAHLEAMLGQLRAAVAEVEDMVALMAALLVAGMAATEPSNPRARWAAARLAATRHARERQQAVCQDGVHLGAGADGPGHASGCRRSAVLEQQLPNAPEMGLGTLQEHVAQGQLGTGMGGLQAKGDAVPEPAPAPGSPGTHHFDASHGTDLLTAELFGAGAAEREALVAAVATAMAAAAAHGVGSPGTAGAGPHCSTTNRPVGHQRRGWGVRRRALEAAQARGRLREYAGVEYEDRGTQGEVGAVGCGGGHGSRSGRDVVNEGQGAGSCLGLTHRPTDPVAPCALACCNQPCSLGGGRGHGQLRRRRRGAGRAVGGCAASGATACRAHGAEVAGRRGTWCRELGTTVGELTAALPGLPEPHNAVVVAGGRAARAGAALGLRSRRTTADDIE